MLRPMQRSVRGQIDNLIFCRGYRAVPFGGAVLTNESDSIIPVILASIQPFRALPLLLLDRGPVTVSSLQPADKFARFLGRQVVRVPLFEWNWRRASRDKPFDLKVPCGLG